MKKFLIISIFLFLLVATQKVEASEDYNTFQEIEISRGKMLSDYTTSDYNKYYKEVDKRKFWGWRVNTINKNVKAKFVSETVFSYYNNGKTPITYKYELSQTVVDKFSISATGTIKYSLEGGTQKFKHDLDTEVKINVTKEIVTTTKEENKLEMGIKFYIR